VSGDSASVLIIDDEPQIRKFLRISLASQGYRVLESTDGRDGLARAALEQPDLVVLDLGLPDMDGQDVLGELRSWTRVPVIVLSVRSSEAEKVRALDAGANDYVTKPFGIQEFLARVRALLRLPQSTTNSPGQVLCGALCIDLAFRRVSLGERMVSLTRKEYAVLAEPRPPRRAGSHPAASAEARLGPQPCWRQSLSARRDWPPAPEARR